MSRRGVIWIGTSLVAASALGIAGVVTAGSLSGDEVDEPSTPVVTVTVERGDLEISTLAHGTLVHPEEREIAGTSGTLTWLPERGALIPAGGTLFRADDRPVVVLLGQFPMWRPLSAGVSDGQDVEQLEQNLATLGFFSRTPDRDFGESTTRAIRAWQKSLGVTQTGSIDPSDVVVSAHPVVVRDVTARLGDPASAPILQVSAEGTSVTAELPLKDRGLAVVGNAVTITLPEGSSTHGTIASVDAPRDVEGTNGTSTIVPITIALDDPSLGGDLAGVGVRVELIAPGRTDVIHVPVSAILALGDATFGVEKRTDDGTELVPVELGLFASGSVEIVSGDLAEGDEIVVPA